MLILAESKEWLEQHNYLVLGDKGYSYGFVVTPRDGKEDFCAKEYASKRVVVENMNALIRMWGACSKIFKHWPEKQEIAIMCCWYLLAIYLEHSPIRLSSPPSS